MISLAIFDFVPNIAFLVSAYFLVRIVYLVRGKVCSAIAIVGAILVALGGFLQAIWKLLYTTGTADIRLLSNVQFILLASGFVFVLIAVIFVALKSNKPTPPSLLALTPWKLPFLIITVIASLIAQGLLIFIALRRHAYPSAVGFFIAFVCLLAMGGMAGGEQTIAKQWIEESVNAIGQISFAVGSYLLYLDFKKFAC